MQEEHPEPSTGAEAAAQGAEGAAPQPPPAEGAPAAAQANENEAQSSASSPRAAAADDPKIEEAKKYLEEVRNQFEDRPHVYNEFLDIMREFSLASKEVRVVWLREKRSSARPRPPRRAVPRRAPAPLLRPARATLPGTGAHSSPRPLSRPPNLPSRRRAPRTA